MPQSNELQQTTSFHKLVQNLLMSQTTSLARQCGRMVLPFAGSYWVGEGGGGVRRFYSWGFEVGWLVRWQCKGWGLYALPCFFLPIFCFFMRVVLTCPISTLRMLKYKLCLRIGISDRLFFASHALRKDRKSCLPSWNVKRHAWIHCRFTDVRISYDKHSVNFHMVDSILLLISSYPFDLNRFGWM